MADICKKYRQSGRDRVSGKLSFGIRKNQQITISKDLETSTQYSTLEEKSANFALNAERQRATALLFTHDRVLNPT